MEADCLGLSHTITTESTIYIKRITTITQPNIYHANGRESNEYVSFSMRTDKYRLTMNPLDYDYYNARFDDLLIRDGRYVAIIWSGDSGIKHRNYTLGPAECARTTATNHQVPEVGISRIKGWSLRQDFCVSIRVYCRWIKKINYTDNNIDRFQFVFNVIFTRSL